MFSRAVICCATAAAGLVVTASATADAGDFTQTGGPAGGSVRVLEADGSDAWAYANQSLFHSADAGASWAPRGVNLPDSFFVRGILATGGSVYLSDETSLLRSTDDGNTFSPVDLGLSNVDSIALHEYGSTLLVSVQRFGQVSDALLQVASDGTVSSIALPGSDLGSVLTGDVAIVIVIDGTLQRSTDDGSSWHPVNIDDGASFFQGLVANDRVMLVSSGFFGNTMHRSTDDGLNWTEFEPVFPSANGVLPRRVFAFGNTLYAQYTADNELTIYRSVDDALTWTESASVGLPDVFLQSTAQIPLAKADNALLQGFGFFGRGVFRSTDEGDTWTSSNAGLIATSINHVGRVGSTLFASEDNGYDNFRAVDEGATWTRIDDLGPVVSSVALDNDTIIVGTFGRGAFRSDDAGVTFAPINAGLPDYVPLDGGEYEPLNDLVVHNGSLFAATGGASEFVGGDGHCGCTGTTSGDGVYRTSNGGASWQRVSTGLPINMVVNGEAILRPINALHSVNGALLAATPDHGVYRSTSNGASWSPTSGAPGGTDFVLFDGDVYLADGAGGLYRSTDDGQSWSIVSTDLPADFNFMNLHVHDNTLYAASGHTIFNPSDGIYSSSNALNWQSASTTLADERVTSMVSSGDDLFVGTMERGVWAMHGDPVTPEDITGDGVVDVFDLLDLLANWGTNGAGSDIAEPNDVVDVFDLLALLAAWGG